MAIIKCKMCGGDMVISDDKTYGTCEYCGSQMTLPKIDDEQRAAAFNRGNHFRRIGEFDRALSVYERIVQENDTDAEAHWCCALCRFGIEYVEDPDTYEWLPTCHRASFDSFLKDVDYLAAVEYSDGITRKQYIRDGAKIAEVQRGILATSRNEEPYDVFICYKESDRNGQRTRDSVLAQEIYFRLVDQGKRVFFAKITLEDKVGTEYEPYIFAALNSAKIMVVVGTSAENLNAVWVKNEWSRFLAMMKHDRNKLLLPCYRDMDPYDMPEQLSIFQAYDMGQIGFIQDLIRGIGKVLDEEQPEKKTVEKPQHPAAVERVVVKVPEEVDVETMLKRGALAMEEHQWKQALGFYEKALNKDAECAAAYLGQFLAENELTSLEAWLSDVRKKVDNLQKMSVSACEEDSIAVMDMVKRYGRTKFLSEDWVRKTMQYDRRFQSYVWHGEKLAAEEKARHEHSIALKRAIRFADEEQKAEIESTVQQVETVIKERLDTERENDRQKIQRIKEAYKVHLQQAQIECKNKLDEQLENSYISSLESKKKAESFADWKILSGEFVQMGGYKDAPELAKYCTVKAEKIRIIEEKYRAAVDKQMELDQRNTEPICFQLENNLENFCTHSMLNSVLSTQEELLNLADSYKRLSGEFASISDYHDAAKLSVQCKKCAASIWRANSRCQYCGGKLTGIFNIRCSSCGADLDY